MISESYRNKIRELAGIKSKYYRAVDTFLGDNVVFEPGGYYEEIGDDDEAVMSFGEYMQSETYETSASKYIGGCVMGAFSGRNLGAKKTNTFYIYEINESPDKDISHWGGGDFMFLEEVRYRRNVTGIYIGKVVLNKVQEEMLDCWYKFYNADQYADEEEDPICDKFRNVNNGDFNDYVSKELKKISVN